MRKQRSIYLTGLTSIVINTILFILKYWVGLITGSIAITADAWHTLSDSITSLIVITSNKISHKPADDQHPFGHGRIELVAALVIGVILAMIAFSFFNDAIQELQEQKIVHYGNLAAIVIAISIFIKELLAQLSFRVGKKVGSRSLRADGWHHRSDALSSITVLIGILFSGYFWWIDGALGILISLLIFHTSYQIIKEAVFPLLGGTPDDTLLEQVKKICYDCYGEEVSTHHFHLHTYGDHQELTLHIRLPGDKTLEEAHRIASGIESRIREILGIETTIHMEPHPVENNEK